MTKSNKTRYIEFVKDHAVPLFFQPQWMDMVSREWNVVMVEDAAKILAVWVYTLEKKIGVSLIRNPFFTPYLGPLFFLPGNLSPKKKEQLQERLFTQLIEQLPRWDFIDVQCLPSVTDFFLFHQHGISHTQRITYYIDVTLDEKTLWGNMSGKQRYAIRQAERDLQLTDADTQSALFYTLHRETLESKGKKYPYTKAFFKKIFDTTRKNNASYTKAAINAKGETTAMVFTVFDADTMYLLLTTNNKLARHNGGVALLIWDAVKKAKQLGLATFDFEGSMDKGIAQFFRSFGGERKTYLHATANRSKIWKLKELMQ